MDLGPNWRIRRCLRLAIARSVDCTEALMQIRRDECDEVAPHPFGCRVRWRRSILATGWSRLGLRYVSLTHTVSTIWVARMSVTWFARCGIVAASSGFRSGCSREHGAARMESQSPWTRRVYGVLCTALPYSRDGDPLVFRPLLRGLGVGMLPTSRISRADFLGNGQVE